MISRGSDFLEFLWKNAVEISYGLVKLTLFVISRLYFFMLLKKGRNNRDSSK